jgi:hypothetical protein
VLEQLHKDRVERYKNSQTSPRPILCLRLALYSFPLPHTCVTGSRRRALPTSAMAHLRSINAIDDTNASVSDLSSSARLASNLSDLKGLPFANFGAVDNTSTLYPQLTYMQSLPGPGPLISQHIQPHTPMHFIGIVETTTDALRLIMAARQGIIPRITRRLNDSERRSMIRSGAVFVFSVEESGIKRWTEGLAWSPSRIVGNFLVRRTRGFTARH